MFLFVVSASSAPLDSVVFDVKANLVSSAESEDFQSHRFDCLPNDVRLTDVVAYSAKGKNNVTVEQTLTRIKAKCRNGKLVDKRRHEIRFFRPSCWGHPPPNYLEIQREEDDELARLKKRYTVIVFGCNPMIAWDRYRQPRVVT
jgi:hypothetical protein